MNLSPMYDLTMRRIWHWLFNCPSMRYQIDTDRWICRCGRWQSFSTGKYGKFMDVS